MDTTNIGTYIDSVQGTLADFRQRGIVERIWRRDHTVWKPDPTEISNRLGWLTITDLMRSQLSTLEAFRDEIRGAYFRHVVLLGMGGSSLGPEVLRQTFGSADGYPELIVLDSTIPSRVQAVVGAIDSASTLFIVSSKSGTTVEPNTLFRYFRSLVASTVGEDKAGENFVAITDPETPLAVLASREGFRRSFINPPDVGGRYSVLSYFGLVPATLIGIDVVALLDHADHMRDKCAEAKSISENPGAWLGAIMGALAQVGQDKLTLFTSPSLSSFGLWVEQLIAESTGKEGKGIVPVVGEPHVEPTYYSDDRLFVCLRLAQDDNSVMDTLIKRMKAAAKPLVLLEMEDKHALGAEFFRWEFAAAIAGANLGINPFDQPDVRAAKQVTETVLQNYLGSGRLPRAAGIAESLTGLLSQARSGDYLAVLAYVQQTSKVDSIMADFRRRIVEKYRLATTLGYGPRYLHSTGQLHKGGPNTGVFLLITSGHEVDVPVPDGSYSFGVLADAQALGDFRALQSLGRRVAIVHVSRDDAEAISKILSGLE